MKGDPLIVCVFTIWSSRIVWISSTAHRIFTPVSRYKLIWKEMDSQTSIIVCIAFSNENSYSRVKVNYCLIIVILWSSDARVNLSLPCLPPRLWFQIVLSMGLSSASKLFSKLFQNLELNHIQQFLTFGSNDGSVFLGYKVLSPKEYFPSWEKNYLKPCFITVPTS